MKMGLMPHTYACSESQYEILQCTAKVEDRVEIIQKEGHRIALDVVDECPPDGTKVLAIEMFHDEKESVVLILWKRGLFTNGYRRLGLCILFMRYFLDSEDYKIITLR